MPPVVVAAVALTRCPKHDVTLGKAKRFCELNGKEVQISDGLPPLKPTPVFVRDPSAEYAPSLDGYSNGEEKLVKMEDGGMFPFKKEDVGKQCIVNGSLFFVLCTVTIDDRLALPPGILHLP